MITIISSKKLDRLLERVKEYKITEENRQFQKQNIKTIENLQNRVEKLAKENSILTASFDAEVKKGVYKEVRKLLTKYDYSTPTQIYGGQYYAQTY